MRDEIAHARAAAKHGALALADQAHAKRDAIRADRVAADDPYAPLPRRFAHARAQLVDLARADLARQRKPQ